MTVNEMIYKTLTTKITKEPKYREVLEALGYELDKNHDWSYYDYWGIKMAEDNRVLVISQNRNKERALFKTFKSVPTKDIKKVDFVNLIKTDRSETRPKHYEPVTLIQAYKYAKRDYKSNINICNTCKQEIQELEERLERRKENLQDWIDRTKDSKEALDRIIAKIKK